MAKERLDVVLTARGLEVTREKAQGLIRAGMVDVGKASQFRRLFQRNR